MNHKLGNHRNIQPAGHTRLPGYAREKVGRLALQYDKRAKGVSK